MKIEVILLPLLIFVSGCLGGDRTVPLTEPIECSTDFECTPAGCSSQLCAPKEKASEIITTCEYREEYSCLELTSCGCVDNKCVWNQNEDYLKCIEEVRS